jgi:predicted transcriptional regulator
MNIKNERKKIGISQIKLAFIAKISRFRLYLHEHGMAQLNPDEIQKIKEVICRGAKGSNHANQ